MKKIFALLLFTAIALFGYSQENMVSVAGGYSWAKVNDADVSATGWRINGTYEFNKGEGKFANGVSIGYISLKATQSYGVVDSTDVEYKLSSLPLYYAPKYFFGGDKALGFVKGAIGGHHSKVNTTGQYGGSVDAQYWGFYGGVGAGFMYAVSEQIFINVEYEFAWMSNSGYSSGFMQTAMGGIGIRF